MSAAQLVITALEIVVDILTQLPNATTAPKVEKLAKKINFSKGACCGSVNDLDQLGCCPVGTECCLNCANSTNSLKCVPTGTCTCDASSTCKNMRILDLLL